eukprot:5970002-Amphidinium_carterae.1
MGALFVTAVTSTLAARLIEFNETQQDLNKKIEDHDDHCSKTKEVVMKGEAITDVTPGTDAYDLHGPKEDTHMA